jgi:histone deacetylase complex regulatory component SIN3
VIVTDGLFTSVEVTLSLHKHAEQRQSQNAMQTAQQQPLRIAQHGQLQDVLPSQLSLEPGADRLLSRTAKQEHKDLSQLMSQKNVIATDNPSSDVDLTLLRILTAENNSQKNVQELAFQSTKIVQIAKLSLLQDVLTSPLSLELFAELLFSLLARTNAQTRFPRSLLTNFHLL